MKFRKKSVVIEAIQWKGEITDLIRFITHTEDWYIGTDKSLLIPTLEGEHRADVGDWIIKGINGEFYPCKPDIFEQTYEPI